jgi:hypothetical protein
MVARVSLRGVVAVASVLGLIVPIALIMRGQVTHKAFGLTELLLYPGSLFLFDDLPHSRLTIITTFSLSLMATVALYALAGMIVYGMFWLFARAGRLVQRRKAI